MTEVHCNGCTACCRGWNVELQPQDDWSTYDHQEGVLRRTADGACVYLGDAGCTIHDRAPYVCRKFDCRVRFLQWQQGEPGAGASKDVLIAGGQRLLEHLNSGAPAGAGLRIEPKDGKVLP